MTLISLITTCIVSTDCDDESDNDDSDDEMDEMGENNRGYIAIEKRDRIAYSL